MPALSRRSSGDGGRRRSRVPLARRFTYRYAVAIILFVALAVTWKVTSDASDQRIRDLTTQLDKAASQPTRVDKITALSYNIFSQGDTADRRQVESWASELEAESTTLQKTQLGLINGDVQLNLPKTPLAPELSAIYNDPGNLKQRISLAANSANLVATLKDNTPSNMASRAEQYEFIAKEQAGLVKDLNRATTLYANLVNAQIDAHQITTAQLLFASLVAGILMLFALFRPMARSIVLETSQLEDAERNHRENNDRQTFRTELAQALEVTDTDDEVLAAVGRAMERVVPDNPVELLLADRNEHLRLAQSSPINGPAGCPVESPMGCAAIRRGHTVVYDSSRMLNVCPKLPQHEAGACSAVCVPVNFMGNALGVLHAVGPDGHPPGDTELERLAVLADETGNRIGILRNTHQTQHDASTDGLTGLENRRSLESKVRGLLLDKQPFSVAMADLDHFKSLNDTHGHEAGDRALRLFSHVLQSRLRPGDIPARYGGEEFVVLLPDTPIAEAMKTLERLQEALALDIKQASGIPFTASWGLTDSTSGTAFDEIVAVADAALYSAKRNGRDCIIVDGEAAATAGMAVDGRSVVPDESNDDPDRLRDLERNFKPVAAKPGPGSD